MKLTASIVNYFEISEFDIETALLATIASFITNFYLIPILIENQNLLINKIFGIIATIFLAEMMILLPLVWLFQPSNNGDEEHWDYTYLLIAAILTNPYASRIFEYTTALSSKKGLNFILGIGRSLEFLWHSW